MDSLRDLLGAYNPKQPAEILIIKRYIEQNFNAQSSVAIQGEAIVITVQSAALANTLRFHTTQLQRACNTTKRLLLRIG